MRNRIVGVTIALVLAAAACGDDDASTDETDAPVAATNEPTGSTDGQGSDDGAVPAEGSRPDTSAGSEATTAPSASFDADGAVAIDGDGVVTVDHAYGTTEIEGVPERIVTLNAQWTDVLLALDVEPVGVLGDTYVGGDGRYSWQRELLPAEAMLDGRGGVPFEQIAALRPDLILGVSFVVENEHQYDLLSEIAPTVIGPLTDRDVDRWQDLMTTAGAILDRPDAASGVIDEVERTVADLKAELPGLAGKTFALAQYIVGDNVYVVADPDDGSSVLFRDLGMEMAPSVLEAARKAPGDDARVELSTEQITVIDSDFLAFLVNGGDESNLSELPGWDTLPSVKNGSVAVLDYDTVVGINTPTPLSIVHALDALRPALEATAAG